MNLSELQELGARTIRPDAPSGDSARDTPEFELLQSEIRKLEAPDQPTVNWEAIGHTGSEILASRSKDLLVGAWVAVAAYETDGFPGLAAGLKVLSDLVDQQWATLFPERPRGRAASFDWLNERGARAVEKGGKRPTAESVQACVDLVSALDEKIGPLLDAPPMLGEIRRALEEVLSNVPASAGAPAPVPSSSSASATSTASASASAAPGGPPAMTAIESEDDLGRALEEVMRLGDLCAAWMRAQNPPDPLGYRIVPMLFWRQILETPPHEDGITVIPDFDPAVLEGLEQALAAGEHAAVIEQAETQFLITPLWFDLTRCMVQALDAQGEAFRPAADAVVFELAQTLKRVPDLLKLKTSGGIPLASDPTKKWIAKRVLTGALVDLGSVAETNGAARVRGGEAFPEAQREARKLARADKLGAALKLLSDGRVKADRLEDRVVWKLEAARLCMQGGRAEMALAQLEALDDELRRSSIEDWDPALCAEILRDLLRCRQQVAQSADFAPSELARSRELMGRLCRLDVVSALELNGRE
jgi:type VI secretion system protein VasJ